VRATQLALLAVVVIVVAGFALLGDDLLRDVEAENYQATEEVLVDMSQLLAALVESGVSPEGKMDLTLLEKAYPQVLERRFFAPIFDIAKSQVTAHVYVTDADGKVVYDSENSKRVGQDLAQKRDVLLTLKGLYGARSTRGDPADSSSSVMHVAAPIRQGENIIGVLTVRKPKIDQWPFVEQRVQKVRLSLLLIGTGIALFVSAVLYWVLHPLRRLTAYIQAVERGERPAMPSLRSSQEVQTLAIALESMRDELEGRDYASRYVQTLTHELKSPLAAIRATSELLAEGVADEPQRQRFLHSLRSETDRTEHLIRQLLRLAEVERMKSLPKPAAVDLVQVVQHAVAELGAAAEAKQVKLELAIAPDRPVMLQGDEMLLRRAVMNLVENAIDFSPSGSVVNVLLVDLVTEARLTVLDEGPGVPDYAQARLFERFYSLKHQVTGRKGSGLGLCFVKETAELHGGSVKLENSTEGKGATAELELPLAV
jgi:two-component system, OmpR family, sensor histidine kinase CreC